jgi:hypothetical protein
VVTSAEVTFKDFVGQGKTFFSHHQCQDDLQGIGPMIAAVAIPRQLDFAGLAFEVGAG